MKLDIKLISLAVLPFILMAAAAMVAAKMDITYKMTKEEQEILGFELKDVSIPERKEVTDKMLQVPTLIEKIMGEREYVPTEEEKKQQEVQLVVTMIIVSERGSMAIVNGMVVMEGDSIGDQKILKIESDKILVEYSAMPDSKNKTKTKTKGTKWVNLS
ncbi:MAG: hypothetical protein HY809_04195 [Nitrospirae bacterium]|nr:hypothetical protein [Nitrospirota bacterium]